MTLALGHTNGFLSRKNVCFRNKFWKIILLKDNLYYLMTIYSVESHQYDPKCHRDAKIYRSLNLWVLSVPAVVHERREIKQSRKLFHGLFPKKLTQIRTKVNQNTLSSNFKSLCYVSSNGKGTRNQISA